MLGNNCWWTTLKRLLSFFLAAVLAWGLVGCSNALPFGKRDGSGIEISQTSSGESGNPRISGQLSEVAPPSAIQKLSQFLDNYQPQVTIVSPQADEVLQDTTVAVQFQVQDLPIFKDPNLGMGPHLHAILDNQPYQAVYDLDQPLVFEDLPPGTHTLRVFASRPWHESFKNEGAYAQRTFHVFTKSSDNNPDPALPLLTYSRPTGSYGAEPIMLDFYLTNAPLHLVARENPDDDIADWRIRVTIDGESFVLDRWQPIYLKGFKRGKNWVKIEFLDEQGNPVKNVFNETVRLISYDPKGKDTLSKLVRGDLSAEAARSIVEPDYKAAPTSTPFPVVTPAPSPSPTPSPTVTPEPVPSIAPSVEATPTPEPETPSEEPAPPVEVLPTPEPEALPTPSESPTAVEEPTPTEEATPTPSVTPQKPKFGGFFNRFRRPGTPSPSPDRIEPEVPVPAPAIAPAEPSSTPEPEASPTPTQSPSAVVEESPQPPEPEASPTQSPSVVEESPQPSQPAVSPTPEPTPTTPVTPQKPKFREFFNRFRRPDATPSESPASLKELEAPVTEPTVVPEAQEPQAEATPQPEELVIPNEPPSGAVEQATPPITKPLPVRPIQPKQSQADGLPPTLPEIVETSLPKPSEPEAASSQPVPESSQTTPQAPTPKLNTPNETVNDVPLGEETIPEIR